MLRLATVEDISEIYMMLMVMHSGTVDGTSPVDSEKLTAAINNTLHKGIVIVFEVDGKIAGSIAGLETSDWWSNDKYLADMWFFVYKEHRKSNIAVKLVKSFMQVAKKSKFKVKLGHVYSGDGDRKDKFFERFGLSKVGSLYTEA
jgi:GNAT superfamily N-acetyltransferase